METFFRKDWIEAGGRGWPGGAESNVMLEADSSSNRFISDICQDKIKNFRNNGITEMNNNSNNKKINQMLVKGTLAHDMG